MIIDIIITVETETENIEIEDMRKEILQLAKNSIDQFPDSAILEPVEP